MHYMLYYLCILSKGNMNVSSIRYCGVVSFLFKFFSLLQLENKLRTLLSHVQVKRFKSHHVSVIVAKVSVIYRQNGLRRRDVSLK